MQSPDRSLVDTLIKDTVHCVLFGDDVRADEAASTRGCQSSTYYSGQRVPNQVTNEKGARSPPSSPLSSLKADIKASERNDTTDARARRLLRQLFMSRFDDDQDDNGDNGERGPDQVDVTLISQQQVLQCCCQWSREALARAKAALKAFLRSVSTHNSNSGAAPDELPAYDTPRGGEARPDRRYAQVFETYALVKLFLLEKDERYRAQKIAEPGGASSRTARSGFAMGSGDSRRGAAVQHRFLVLLRVQLALYAHYFELANGRKVGEVHS